MRQRVVRQMVGVVGALLIALTSIASHAEDAPKLLYGFEKGKKYAYDFKIEITVQDYVESRSGIVIFESHSSTDAQFNLKSTGRLSVSSQGRRMGPPIMPFPPMGHGRFGVRLPTEWTLTRQGDIVIVGPIEQIPYALGPVDLLIIEPLPTEPKSKWDLSEEKGVVETSRGRGRFGPFAGESVAHGATEKAEYEVTSATPDVVQLSKTYSLKTAPVDDGGIQTQLTMTGKGELEFDRKRGVFKSNSSKYDLAVAKKNSTLTMPLTLTYRLLTDQELADHEAAQKAKAEAEAKAKEPKAVDDAERTALLKDLQSKDDKAVNAALERLARGIVDDHAAEISAAVAPLLHHPNDWVKPNAAKALKVWATPEAEAAIIEASQSENMWLRAPAIEALGRIPSEAAAEAAAAQFMRSRGEAARALKAMGPVAEKATIPWLKEHDFAIHHEACNIAAEIGGEASLAVLEEQRKKGGWEKNEVERAISAIKFRLETGGKAASKTPASKAGNDKGASGQGEVVSEHSRTITINSSNPEKDGLVRTWHAANGNFTVEATFVGITDDKVQLKKKDGKTINVPMKKLSEADQTWVKEYFQGGPNPFE